MTSSTGCCAASLKSLKAFYSRLSPCTQGTGSFTRISVEYSFQFISLPFLMKQHYINLLFFFLLGFRLLLAQDSSLEERSAVLQDKGEIINENGALIGSSEQSGNKSLSQEISYSEDSHSILPKVEIEFIDVNTIAKNSIMTESDLHDNDFRIGKNNITVRQYCAFLNAIAATDTYNLYKEKMGDDLAKVSIVRSGDPGCYRYSVQEENESDDLPITYITWFDALRFCNWMHHDQPVGLQDNTTTEDGAYCLHNEASDFPLMREDAKYFLPTENQWNNALYDKKIESIPGSIDGSLFLWSNTFDSNMLCSFEGVLGVSLVSQIPNNHAHVDFFQASNAIGFRLATRALISDRRSLIQKLPLPNSNDYWSPLQWNHSLKATDWFTSLRAALFIVGIVALSFAVTSYLSLSKIALGLLFNALAFPLRKLARESKLSTVFFVEVFCAAFLVAACLFPVILEGGSAAFLAALNGNFAQLSTLVTGQGLPLVKAVAVELFIVISLLFGVGLM